MDKKKKLKVILLKAQEMQREFYGKKAFFVQYHKINGDENGENPLLACDMVDVAIFNENDVVTFDFSTNMTNNEINEEYKKLLEYERTTKYSLL
jgi:hypothetical protein